MRTVSFIHMEDGTREDYGAVVEYEARNHGQLADRLLAELKRAGDLQGPWKITRYQHSLQTATRALRGDADEETVVAALLHDIGDGLGPANHSEVAAAILRPYVSEPVWWVVKHHGLFQGYYYFHHLGLDRDAREKFRGHPHYERTAHFCHAFDQPAFDPDYPTEPIETFEPMVRRLFARNPFVVEA
jgi:predicted HD phosphohydrolase